MGGFIQTKSWLMLGVRQIYEKTGFKLPSLVEEGLGVVRPQ
jgi:hypothetical protein